MRGAIRRHRREGGRMDPAGKGRAERRARVLSGLAAAGLTATLTLASCAQPPTDSAGTLGIPGIGSGAISGPAAATDPDLLPAPEVFAASGTAIWNGMQTVSGRWVSHPAADETRPVRVVYRATGAEVDAMLYPPEADRRAAGGDVVTVSSDLARALGLEPGAPAMLALFALRPATATSARQRRATETAASSELASHIARMDGDELLRLVAAAMRGAGYATAFAPRPAGALPEIRAIPLGDAGAPERAARVLVRPAGMAPASAADLATWQETLAGSGEHGIVVSIPGFAADAADGTGAPDPMGAAVDLVDLDRLLGIWTTRYARLAAPDRALLPLHPVWFLATEADAAGSAGMAMPAPAGPGASDSPPHASSSASQ